jgi:hypothetical protein
MVEGSAALDLAVPPAGAAALRQRRFHSLALTPAIDRGADGNLRDPTGIAPKPARQCPPMFLGPGLARESRARDAEQKKCYPNHFPPHIREETDLILRMFHRPINFNRRVRAFVAHYRTSSIYD